jgi:hypothetical protein
MREPAFYMHGGKAYCPADKPEGAVPVLRGPVRRCRECGGTVGGGWYQPDSESGLEGHRDGNGEKW